MYWQIGFLYNYRLIVTDSRCIIHSICKMHSLCLFYFCTLDMFLACGIISHSSPLAAHTSNYLVWSRHTYETKLRTAKHAELKQRWIRKFNKEKKWRKKTEEKRGASTAHSCIYDEEEKNICRRKPAQCRVSYFYVGMTFMELLKSPSAPPDLRHSVGICYVWCRLILFRLDQRFKGPGRAKNEMKFTSWNATKVHRTSHIQPVIPNTKYNE